MLRHVRSHESRNTEPVTERSEANADHYGDYGLDGRVAITFLIDHTISGTITVTEVQLYDHSGRLWASKVESITRKAAQEGILYRFAITITES